MNKIIIFVLIIIIFILVLLNTKETFTNKYSPSFNKTIIYVNYYNLVEPINKEPWFEEKQRINYNIIKNITNNINKIFSKTNIVLEIKKVELNQVMNSNNFKENNKFINYDTLVKRIINDNYNDLYINHLIKNKSLNKNNINIFFIPYLKENIYIKNINHNIFISKNDLSIEEIFKNICLRFKINIGNMNLNSLIINELNLRAKILYQKNIIPNSIEMRDERLKDIDIKINRFKRLTSVIKDNIDKYKNIN